MGVAVALVADDAVHARSVVSKRLGHVVAEKADSTFGGEDPRQGGSDFPGKLGAAPPPVHEELDMLDVVPEPLRQAGPGQPLGGFRPAPGSGQELAHRGVERPLAVGVAAPPEWSFVVSPVASVIRVAWRYATRATALAPVVRESFATLKCGDGPRDMSFMLFPCSWWRDPECCRALGGGCGLD